MPVNPKLPLSPPPPINLPVVPPPIPKTVSEPHTQEQTSEGSGAGVSGEQVVLPAAMGGSWKEAMYMRLNNKVLQLQSDVSVSMR